MADLEPLDQADPGQPVVTAPTILNGARLNNSLDTYAGSRTCYKPCVCPTAMPRACTPNYDPDADMPGDIEEECESITFDGFDWFAIDSTDLDECGGCGDMIDMLNETVASGAAYIIGREIDSAPLTGNPSLQSEAIDIAPGIVSHPADALAMLIQAAALKGHYRSTFIAPDHLQPALEESGLLRQVNGQWRLSGRPIVFSPGITGLGPAGVDPGPGAAYIYLVGGAIDYNWSPVNWADIGVTGTVEDVRKNQVCARAQASGIVRFNPLCIHAIAVCLKHVSCCAGDGEAMERAAVLGAAASPGQTLRNEAKDARTSELLEAGAAAIAAREERAEAEAAAKREAEDRARRAAEAEEVQRQADIEEAQRLAEAERATTEAIVDEVLADELPEPELFEPEPVPDGTVAEVLAWVDGDRDRALEAVSLEGSDQGRNRSTLIEALNEIIEGDA